MCVCVGVWSVCIILAAAASGESTVTKPQIGHSTKHAAPTGTVYCVWCVCGGGGWGVHMGCGCVDM